MPGEHPHRRHQLHQVGRERQERAQRDAGPRCASQPPKASTATWPSTGMACSVGVNGACRRISRIREPEEVGAGVGQVAQLAVLLAEALDHPHAGHRLVDHAGHLGGALLGVPRRGVDDRAQPQGDDQHRRQGQRHHGGERRRQDDHHHQRHHQQHEVPEHDRQERQQALDERHVARRPADQLAGLEPVVAGEVEALQPLEDGVAQVVLDVERHPAGRRSGARRRRRSRTGR